MAGPNMATITASLERSFQNCSLNNNNNQITTRSSSASSSSPTRQQHSRHEQDDLQNPNDTTTTTTTTTTLELNSHISLPYHWEQCLDLKTGEIYYINWRNGMKAKEDPRKTTTTTRTTSSTTTARRYYYDSDEEEEDDEEEEKESSYDSEESSSESSGVRVKESEKEEVLVVSGCKSCFMYFMVPKHVRHCPKCSGHLLHFDRSQNASL